MAGDELLLVEDVLLDDALDDSVVGLADVAAAVLPLVRLSVA